MCEDQVEALNATECLNRGFNVTSDGVCRDGDVIVATWDADKAQFNNLVVTAPYGFFR